MTGDARKDFGIHNREQINEIHHHMQCLAGKCYHVCCIVKLNSHAACHGSLNTHVHFTYTYAHCIHVHTCSLCI